MNSYQGALAYPGQRGIKSELRRLMPRYLWQLLHDARGNTRLLRYRAFGRPISFSETAKARARRLREGFFEKYCSGRGLDIGYGGDLLCANAIAWDVEHGDGQRLDRIANDTMDFVYSSHTLEHVHDASEALRNWYRVVKPGGHLILFVPDRDLYEKRTQLPSRFNPDHKRFFLLDREEPPDTVALLPMIAHTIPHAEIVAARRCAEGRTISDPDLHSDGEYSLEVIVRKPPA